MLREWIKENNLICREILPNVVECEELGVLLEIKGEEFVLDENLILSPSSEEFELIAQLNPSYLLFSFGGQYYYSPTSKIDDQVSFNLFKWIGKSPFSKLKTPFLGIHGRYEILNGSRDYIDWCKKARFLGIDTLGICENSTLAGTLAFQIACQDYKIKSIIGAEYNVEFSGNKIYKVKFYVVNSDGWVNLLNINKVVNIDNKDEGVIFEEQLKELSSNLICVYHIDYESDLDLNLSFLRSCNFTDLYVQIDLVEYEDEDLDEKYLNNYKEYFEKYLNKIKPVFIPDAYYLDKEDYVIKEILNQVGSIKRQTPTRNQYFKHFIELMEEFEKLFKETDLRFDNIVDDSLENCKNIGELCNFNIELGKRHLPNYEMNEEEIQKYGDSKNMFISLLEEGVERKIDKNKYDLDVVYDRLEKEIKVIINANVQDYFLILWDVIKWCKKNNILTGIGRGSAGGCLSSYLLDIIKINPLDYDLLFERFLNEGRALQSLPDIDTDFEGRRRDEVKRYMESKYGVNFVASVGTFTTLQVKAAVKDLNRIIGNTDAGSMNYITRIFDGEKWEDLFKESIKKPALKKWIIDNSEIINLIPLCYNSPKSKSVHPCATIVIPKDDSGLDIYSRIPVRTDDNGDLVTEWEGEYIETAGYLKEDILGIKQLDKFRAIFDLIKERDNIELDLENIPLNDPEVLKYFGQGFTKDVFHFGSDSLSNYMRLVNPTSITDLINSNALFRPGAMASNAHIDYIKLKEGEKEPEYDFKLKEVTEDTFSLYIFQEQVMKACQVLGDFTLAEADDIRKAMGKQKQNLIDSYKERFIENAIKKGCSGKEANEIWKKLEVFAGYGFNKSHSAAYAITGYICNWLKYHYPIHFWTVALEFAKDDQIPGFVSEISKTQSIQIMPPDVNSSDIIFRADFEKRYIYWTINKIKGVGNIAVDEILKQREKKGRVFSLEDFLHGMEKSVIKKNIVEAMILSGCFDLIYDVKELTERRNILEEFYELRKIKDKDRLSWLSEEDSSNEWYWALKQYELSGLGEISYKKIIHKCETMHPYKFNLVDADEFHSTKFVNEYVVVGGVISEVSEKKTKKGMMGNVVINHNSQFIHIRVWSEQWEGDREGYSSMRDDLLKAKNRVLFISGIVAEPSQYNPDNILQTVGGNKKTLYEIL